MSSLNFPALRWCLLGLTLAVLAACKDEPPVVISIPAAMAMEAPVVNDDHCGGAMEARTWALWDAQGRKLLRDQLIGARLLEQGDSYALYDMQGYFHNLQAMAQRCGRTDRLVQLADDLLPLFDALQDLPGGQEGQRGWVCRGGAVCNARNGLVNKEVMLVSLQGLGLLSELARNLATSTDSKAQVHPFIGKTVQASLMHLQRWGGTKERNEWLQMANASPSDARSGGSALFFTDRHLWLMSVYAHLAGIAQAQPHWFADAKPGSSMHAELAANMAALLQFFERRTSTLELDSASMGRVQLADLDKGFRYQHPDNRFAGYTEVTPPVVCKTVQDDTNPAVNKKPARMQPQLQMEVRRIPLVKDLSWDFSHARRLVHFFDALGANRQAIEAWWGIASKKQPSPDLARAFAAQLLTKVWNGDLERPLFTNYWSGANGWYRVAYDNGTGKCYAGYKPYGMSDAFSTGGYAQWAEYYPVIGVLGRKILELTESGKPDDVAFVQDYYSGLSSKAAANARMLQQLMFWPSLVR